MIALALLSQAQNEFHSGGLDLSQYHISYLQAHMHPTSDTFDSVKVERIINILQSNLQQWGFVEGQLMEPGVNLKMPEIMIPLRHLTTTLEVLGNIFFVKGEICEARCFLERACPLLELLPMEEDMQSLSTECYGVLKQIYTSLYSTAAGALGGGTEGDGMENNTLLDCDTSKSNDCTLSISEPKSGTYKACTCSNDAVPALPDPSGMSLAQRLESLRSPYEHLRPVSAKISLDADVGLQNTVETNKNSTKNLSDDTVTPPPLGSQQAASKGESVIAGKGGGVDDEEEDGVEVHADLDEYEGVEDDGDGREEGKSELQEEHKANINDLPRSGLSPVMWKMLLEFVREDPPGRRDILHQSRQHYAELHSNIEEFNTEEVVSRLAMADAHLAIMHKAAHEGFAFIDKELTEYRGSPGEVVDMEEFVSIHGELSPGENARLVVLTAFDRALTEAQVKRGHRKGRGERRRQRIRKPVSPEKPKIGENLKLSPEEDNKDVGDTSIGSGDNISTTLILMFIVAIGGTLYASFMETNKRRGSGQRQKLRGGRKTLHERFDNICELLYGFLESQPTPTSQKMPRTTQQSSEKKARDSTTKKNKQPKKAKTEKDTKRLTVDNISDDSIESEDSGDEDIQLRVLKSTAFKDGGAVHTAAYEQEPDSTDTFFTEESIFRTVDPESERGAAPSTLEMTTEAERRTSESSSGKTTVEETIDNDEVMHRQRAALAAEKAAASEEKARKKAERKEKDKIWKQQQKELKAARRAAAAVASAEASSISQDQSSGMTVGSGVIPPPRSPEKSLLGLLGGSTDLNLDLDFSSNAFTDGLDLGGVVGGNRGGFHSHNTGLGSLTDPSAESDNPFSMGMPAFSLFGSAPAEQQELLLPAPISAPLGMSPDTSSYDSGVGMHDLSSNGPPHRLFGNSNIPSLPSDLLDGGSKPTSPATLPPLSHPPPGLSNSSSGVPDAPPGLSGLEQSSSFENMGAQSSVCQDNLICQFSCRCTFLSASSIGSVKIQSPQLGEPFVMERAHLDDSVWLACISLPRAHVTFRYKYVVENQLGIRWEEDRQHRIVFLKTNSETISNDDTIESGIVT